MRHRSPAPRFAGKTGLRPGDLETIARQLGRRPRDLTGIAARCPFGCPAVIETAPLLTDGAPNPTLLYLVCPALTQEVSRAEGGGAVRAFKSWVRVDPAARAALEEIARLYRERRAALAGARLARARPDAGIGGPAGPEKASCLHAYAAALLAVMSGWATGSSLGEGAELLGAAVTKHGGAGNAGASARRGAGAERGPGAERGAGAAWGPGAERAGDEAPALVSEACRIWTRFLPPVEESWCRDRRCIGDARDAWCAESYPDIRAAIDVGTISVRLLVAEVEGRTIRGLARLAEVTRLGEGVQPGGRLSETARNRTAAVVARYVREARRLGAAAPILAGTSATREAIDGQEFIRSLGAENDVTAAVLTGRAEAELAFVGATLDVLGGAVVLDVGGGSTELIRRSGGGQIETASLNLGASRATDRWIRSDPPSSGEMKRIYTETEQALLPLRSRFGRGDGTSAASPRLVGVAGTVTTLACMDAGLQVYDDEVLHLRTLPLVHIKESVARLGALTLRERAALPCVQRGRAPVIVAGAVIVLATMETLGYTEMTVSVRDLLDGLVLHGRDALSFGNTACERAAP